MRLRHPWAAGRPARSGKLLILFTLLLPALLGMTGLVIDGGLLMVGQRQAQNAADAAAMVAALDYLRGQSSNALSDTNTYVQTYNGLSNAPNLVSGTTFNSPPSAGAYKGVSNFVEVIVTNPVTTYFMPVLGFSSSQDVQARAVAGYVAVASGEGVLALDTTPPGSNPGISTSGNGALKVNGSVYSNDTSSSSSIETNGSHAYISAQSFYSAASPVPTGNFYQYPNTSGTPVTVNSVGVTPDPLDNLPTPVFGTYLPTKYASSSSGTMTSGWPPTSQAPLTAVNISGGSVTLNPGIYSSISISGQGTVTFNPGIYVLTGADGSCSSLYIEGGTSQMGSAQGGVSGVMFYVTAGNYSVTPNTGYNPNTGAPDSSDDDQTPPTSGLPTFGAINLAGNATGTLNPLSGSGTSFDGLLFYYRRWDTGGGNPVFYLAGSNSIVYNGTIYAKWGGAQIAGNGTYNAQFIVGYVTISGNGAVTINHTGSNFAKANQVFLVE